MIRIISVERLLLAFLKLTAPRFYNDLWVQNLWLPISVKVHFYTPPNFYFTDHESQPHWHLGCKLYHTVHWKTARSIYPHVSFTAFFTTMFENVNERELQSVRVRTKLKVGRKIWIEFELNMSYYLNFKIIWIFEVINFQPNFQNWKF